MELSADSGEVAVLHYQHFQEEEAGVRFLSGRDITSPSSPTLGS